MVPPLPSSLAFWLMYVCGLVLDQGCSGDGGADLRGAFSLGLQRLASLRQGGARGTGIFCHGHSDLMSHFPCASRLMRLNWCPWEGVSHRKPQMTCSSTLLAQAFLPRGVGWGGER